MSAENFDCCKYGQSSDTYRLTVIVGDDVETVKQLSLVFVDSLDLNVEHGVGVDLHFVVLLQVHSKLQLVFLFSEN